MFSLIITIVSIALVVALIGATMYYGGDTLSQGRAKADASAYVSGAQQVVGALQMYNAMESGQPDSLDDLITAKYLSSLPVMKSGTWTIPSDATADRILTITVDNAEVCESINSQVVEKDEGEVTAPTDLTDLTYACISGELQMRY